MGDIAKYIVGVGVLASLAFLLLWFGDWFAVEAERATGDREENLMAQMPGGGPTKSEDRPVEGYGARDADAGYGASASESGPSMSQWLGDLLGAKTDMAVADREENIGDQMIEGAASRTEGRPLEGYGTQYGGYGASGGHESFQPTWEASWYVFNSSNAGAGKTPTNVEPSVPAGVPGVPSDSSTPPATARPVLQSPSSDAGDEKNAEKPRKHPLRVWTSSTGEHSIRAMLVSATPDTVRLSTEDQTVSLPLDKLSGADREYVDTVRRWQIAEVKDEITFRHAALKRYLRDHNNSLATSEKEAIDGLERQLRQLRNGYYPAKEDISE